MSSVLHNLDTEQWQSLDRAHHFHPFTDHAKLWAKGTRIIERAEGVNVWDTDGKRLIDGMAGLWCVNLGYGRRELADAAHRQMMSLAYYNTFFQTAHPPAVELARKLASLAPGNLNRVFFTSSGSESNDTVVRMVRRYWDVAGQPSRNIIISRENAYHGSTVAASSLGGMKTMHEQAGMIPGIEHITQPYWYKLGGNLSPAEFGLRAAQALEARIESVGAENVAAFIAEPVQGAGGVIVPPETYWPEVSRICKAYDILLVADEVICGFGRTGRWFGSDYYGIQPDLMSIAKGLSSGYIPIGGVMITDRIAETLASEGGEFQHGYTYSGHPVACAVASENLRLLESEGVVTRVAQDIGPYFQQSLRDALESHPLVGEVRGIGLFAALQLVRHKASRTLFEPEGDVGLMCREFSMDSGLIMRATGDSMILSPALVVSRAEVDEIVDKAKLSLDRTAEALDAA